MRFTAISGAIQQGWRGRPTNPPVQSAGPFAHVLGSGTTSDDQTVLVGKHPSAKYIFVTTTGNDTTGDGTSGNPYATPQKGWSMITDGAGDWLLMAEGDSFSSFITSGNKNGLSTTYPIVVSTYDKTDATNVAKYRRPTGLFTAVMTGEWIIGLNCGVCTLFENFSLSASSQTEFHFLSGVNGGDTTKNCTLWNVRTTSNVQISVETATGDADTSTARTRNFVMRRCAMSYSQGQGFYCWKTDGMVLEDSILWHNGWNGTTRQNGSKNPTYLDHNAYLGVANDNFVFRRNVSMDASSHGLQSRGGGTVTNNVFFRNPINCLLGGGDNHDVIRPSGVDYIADDNLVIDSDDMTSNPVDERGAGMQFTNTKSSGHANRNLIIWRRTGSSADWGAMTAQTSNGLNVPAYLTGTQNTIFSFGSLGTFAGNPNEPFPSAIHVSLTKCVLPYDTPSGSNVSSPTTPHPNTALDMTSYATSKGYGSIAAMQSAMIANPRADWANEIRAHVLPGYSVQP